MNDRFHSVRMYGSTAKNAEHMQSFLVMQIGNHKTTLDVTQSPSPSSRRLIDASVADYVHGELANEKAMMRLSFAYPMDVSVEVPGAVV